MLVGSAMTYTLFEYAKDNVDALMPDDLLSLSNVQVSVLFAVSYLEIIFLLNRILPHRSTSVHVGMLFYYDVHIDDQARLSVLLWIEFQLNKN